MTKKRKSRKSYLERTWKPYIEQAMKARESVTVEQQKWLSSLTDKQLDFVTRAAMSQEGAKARVLLSAAIAEGFRRIAKKHDPSKEGKA